MTRGSRPVSFILLHRFYLFFSWKAETKHICLVGEHCTAFLLSFRDCVAILLSICIMRTFFHCVCVCARQKHSVSHRAQTRELIFPKNNYPISIWMVKTEFIFNTLQLQADKWAVIIQSLNPNKWKAHLENRAERFKTASSRLKCSTTLNGGDGDRVIIGAWSKRGIKDRVYTAAWRGLGSTSCIHIKLQQQL